VSGRGRQGGARRELGAGDAHVGRLGVVVGEGRVACRGPVCDQGKSPLRVGCLEESSSSLPWRVVRIRGQQH